MGDADIVDIPVVEDNPCDAELMLRAFRKQNIINPLLVLDDGAAAPDILF